MPSVRSLRQFVHLFDKEGWFSKTWNSPWFGAPLWSIAALLTFWWLIHLPSPGKAIGALAVVAGIMSVRDMKVLGKLLWVVLLVLMLITEFRAINKDRSENDEKQRAFFDAQQSGFQHVVDQAKVNFDQTATDLKTTIGGLKTVLATTQLVEKITNKNLENITGGDSYAYVYPAAAEGNNEVTLSIHNDGDQQLSGVNVTIRRVLSGSVDPMDEHAAERPLVTDDSAAIPLGSLAPHDGRTVPGGVFTPTLDRSGYATYRIFINAQNPGTAEILAIRRSKSGRSWAYKFDAWKVVTGKRRKSDVLAKSDGKWIRYMKRQDWTEPPH
jgi:hypothetical protein